MREVTLPHSSATEPWTSVAVGRLHFLDHLRATVILLVILLHASMTYMAFAPEWWYVIEPNGSLSFTYLVLVLDVPIMLILFFIAGFFAYGSLEKYGAGRFMRQKLVRIGIPWVFGVLVLAPLVTYLIPFTRGMEISFLQFWTNDFWGVFYQQSVYWFLGILLLLFGILAALYRYEPRLSDVERSNATPTPSFLWTFWGLTSVWFFVATLVMPADTWQNAARVFVFQPARLLLYGGYFALGIYADRRGWLRPGGYLPDLGQWAPAMLICGAAYLGLRIIWQDGNLLFLVAQAALFNTFCLTATFAALSFFQQVQQRIVGRLGQPVAQRLRHLLLASTGAVPRRLPGTLGRRAAIRGSGRPDNPDCVGLLGHWRAGAHAPACPAQYLLVCLTHGTSLLYGCRP